MAVITTAIAVGAAAAISAGAVAAGVATVATVATVAAVVATAGVAMTVVGMVTENKDLTKIGGIMTAVGGGAGLGALAAGALGLGSAAASTATSAGSSVASAAPAAEAAAPAATSVINPSVSASVTQSLAQAGQTGAGTVLAPAVAQTGVGAGTVLAPAASGAASGSSGLITAAVPAASKVASQVMAPAAPSTPTPSAPIAPPAPSAPGVVTPTVGVDPGVSIAGAAKPGFWDGLDPSVKAMMMMGGTQMLGQGAAGMFAGASQSEQNDLLARRIGIEQQVADQTEAQREFLREGGRYAPRVTFNRPKGMIAHQFPSFPA